MSHRAVISITNGKVEASFWAAASLAEAPTKGRPKGCGRCPLRVGGPWTEGAEKAAASATPEQRVEMELWGCHEEPRPCAGMRRILGRR